MPTPSGVPVKIRSPGERVQIDDRYETSLGTEKMSCDVEDSWTTSPQTSQRSAMSSRSRRVSTETTAGPVGP